MKKIDKTQFSKSQWRVVKEERRQAKQIKNNQNVNPPVAIEPLESDLRKTNINKNLSGVAFVIGNGVSRKNINIFDLKQQGVIYGCNAIYREFEPDYLIAVDAKMITEIVQTGYHLKNNVWTNYNRAYSKYNSLNFFQPSKGWSSGPTALHMASEKNYKTIYILGFDYIGIGDRVNNIYSGTHNYKKTDERATYYGNWLRQTQTVIKNNQQIEYIRVIDESGFIPKEFSNLNNLSHSSVEKFIDTLKKDNFF
jgi:hypothetical protein